tara:strand:+ start:218 stop:625 length:408 start_codon:yes stop_codon:yes gene_type:complete
MATTYPQKNTNTNENRNVVNLQNKKAGGNNAQMNGNNLSNQVVLHPSVGQRNIIVRTKTMVLMTPEGEKIPQWIDADTITPKEWKAFFAQSEGFHGKSRVRTVRQAINPLSLHERQLMHAKKHPNDTTAQGVVGA